MKNIVGMLQLHTASYSIIQLHTWQSGHWIPLLPCRATQTEYDRRRIYVAQLRGMQEKDSHDTPDVCPPQGAPRTEVPWSTEWSTEWSMSVFLLGDVGGWCHDLIRKATESTSSHLVCSCWFSTDLTSHGRAYCNQTLNEPFDAVCFRLSQCVTCYAHNSRSSIRQPPPPTFANVHIPSRAMWGLIIKKAGIFLNFKWPKITLSFFFTLINFSGGELPVDKKCDFSSFLWVKASLVESHLLFTFPFIAFHFAFISFHFAFMSFHVPSMYQGYRSAKADMLKPVRWVSFSYRFGGLCRLPSSGFMNMYMYKLIIVFFTFIISYRFLGRQCIGSVKMWRCKPS